MKLNIQLFAYTKKEWKDLPSKDTPILAADLNNIENGIATTLSPDAYYGKTEIDNKENKLKAENEYLNSVIEQAFTPVEKEGTSINYDNTINARFKDIKLCGDTTQNGTPTPDTPVEIQNVTGLQNINVCGKNLFDIADGTYTVSGTGRTASITFTNGIMTNFEHNYSGNFGIKVPLRTPIILKANQSYTRGTNSNYTYPYITLYDVNSQAIDGMTASDNGVKTFTPTEQKEVHYIFLWFDYNYTYTELKPMMNIGSTLETFEKYDGETYTIHLGDIELCKIGDYQDYIHKDNGKWYKHKVIGKVVLSGIEDIKNDNVYNNIYQFSFPVSNPLNNIYSITMSSNYFKSVEWNNSWAIDNSCVTLIGADKLLIMTSKYTNVNDFKAFLKEKYNNNKPIICYYILATPIATEITDTTLLEQLEELAGATTYAGETNIVATSDGLTIIPKTTALTK